MQSCKTLSSDTKECTADLHKPGLGLSEEDEARIVNEVQFVIHSAASISFFEHIHTLLEQNYEVGHAFYPVFHGASRLLHVSDKQHLTLAQPL